MARRSLKQWMLAANGWQRIWFVFTIASFGYFLVFYPLAESNKGSSYRYESRWTIEKEMQNPLCAPYMSEPFEKLVEPEFDLDAKGCYSIYSHRKYREGNPITPESYRDRFSSEEREIWLTFIGMGLFIAVLISALTYGFGVIVAWVIKGFRKSAS